MDFDFHWGNGTGHLVNLIGVLIPQTHAHVFLCNCVDICSCFFLPASFKSGHQNCGFHNGFFGRVLVWSLPESTGIMRGVERDHDGIISVTLRNPWGFDETMPAGEFLRTWHCMRQSRKSALGCCLPVYHVNQLASCFSLGWFSPIKVIKIVRPMHCFKEILSVTGSFFLVWQSLQKVHKSPNYQSWIPPAALG